MWKANHFPRDRYHQMIEMLHERGFDAHHSLWDQK
jgi:hypothetical protein